MSTIDPALLSQHFDTILSSPLRDFIDREIENSKDQSSLNTLNELKTIMNRSLEVFPIQPANIPKNNPSFSPILGENVHASARSLQKDRKDTY